jgi:hypothetical protein
MNISKADYTKLKADADELSETKNKYTVLSKTYEQFKKQSQDIHAGLAKDIVTLSAQLNTCMVVKDSAIRERDTAVKALDTLDRLSKLQEDRAKEDY